jgi:peptide/nickel transport system permease protein
MDRFGLRRRLVKSRAVFSGLRLSLLLAGLWLGLVGLVSLFAPWLTPVDPAAVNPDQTLAAPSPAHPLGADLLGRDVLSRMVWGTRRTLGMALLAMLMSSVTGTVVGLAAGYGGPWWDNWLMRGVEVALALPQLLVALVVISAAGHNPWAVGFTVGLTGIAGFARAAVLQVRGQVYIQAAEALGASPAQVALCHILPNIAGPLAALTTIHFAWAILNTATLTFLGFGGAPSAPDWGLILNEGRAYLLSAPWVSSAPGVAITLTVLAANALGNRWEN